MDLGFFRTLFGSPPRGGGNANCSGCGLCQLVCPVWRESRDVEMTPHGRAKAIQNGAVAADISASVASCTLCGSCDAVCPEQIPIVELTLELKRELKLHTANVPRVNLCPSRVSFAPSFHLVTDMGPAMGASGEQLDAYLRPLRGAGTLVVADGLLLRRLRQWIPGKRMISLGKVLSQQACVRRSLGPEDLYVIDAQAYNLDYEGNVGHYDRLRHATGCMTNLDLQRIALPADDVAQAQWILRGLRPTRIVVENVHHWRIFTALGHGSVLHVSELATEFITEVKH